jgi:hypothetical protein
MIRNLCRFCGKSWWESIGPVDTVTVILHEGYGFTWWHTACVEWCDWRWED